MSTYRNHRPSAAQGLHAYGLAGIDIQRRSEGRAPNVGGQGRDSGRTGLVHRLRLAAGNAFITLGTGIAGETARPAASAAIQPKVDMA